jgi:hypothetical protein
VRRESIATLRVSKGKKTAHRIASVTHITVCAAEIASSNARAATTCFRCSPARERGHGRVNRAHDFDA